MVSSPAWPKIHHCWAPNPKKQETNFSRAPFSLHKETQSFLGWLDPAMVPSFPVVGTCRCRFCSESAFLRRGKKGTFSLFSLHVCSALHTEQCWATHPNTRMKEACQSLSGLSRGTGHLSAIGCTAVHSSHPQRHRVCDAYIRGWYIENEHLQTTPSCAATAYGHRPATTQPDPAWTQRSRSVFGGQPT